MLLFTTVSLIKRKLKETIERYIRDEERRLEIARQSGIEKSIKFHEDRIAYHKRYWEDLTGKKWKD